MRPQHFLAAVLAFFTAVLRCSSAAPSAPGSVASSGCVIKTSYLTGCTCSAVPHPAPYATRLLDSVRHLP